MRIYSVLQMATIALIVSTSASSMGRNVLDQYVTEFWNGEIKPHFDAYRRCGIRHFRTLGGKDVRPFKNVEASVRQPCGKHIAEVRKAIKKIGIHSKNRRTAIINLEYKRILQDFRIAYLSAKSEMLITTKLKEVMPDWKSCVERFSRITDKPSGLSADHLVKIALWYCLKE